MPQDYTKLIAKWPSVVGASTQAKLDALNGPTNNAPDPAGPRPALLQPSQIVNAITPTDLAALTTGQLQILLLMLQGSTVDASPGTTIRLAAQNIFQGKATTLANLASLVAPFDAPTIPWWQANGYTSPISMNDLAAAGNLT